MKYLTVIILTILIVLIALFSQSLFSPVKGVEPYIQSYVEEHQFNGTILVQMDSAVLYHKSFGVADRRFNVPITNRTVYKVASITKAFTAALILQLYDNNKLELNKPIINYLPNYEGEAGKKVTIHQLLNHTSGMRQIDTISSLDNAFKYGLGYLQKPRTSDQLFQSFEQDSLVNEPGKKWDYNNYEYIVLGKIIENLYGKSYGEVLDEKILTPLNMTDSGLCKEKDIIKNLASTYFTGNNPNLLVNDLPVFIENYYAAGAMYSSPNDLLKFSNALFGMKLIKKKSLDLMLTAGLNKYGYGVWIRGIDADKRMERYGRIMGANAVWMNFLNKKTTIIILSNTNLTNLGEFALGIQENLIKPNS